MQTETEDLLNSAIVKVRNKFSPPRTQSKPIFVPEERYRELLPMLDIFDLETNDEDTDTKAKFIYEYLGENPKDKLMSIYTTLGSNPPTQRKIDRVYKYCRLQEQARKTMTRYEQLQGDINALGNR